MSFGGLEHGAAGRRAAAPAMAEINMTPLIDVMLVLLVIFILTAPLLTHAIRLDLPHASSTSAPDTPRTITVALDADGKLYWNEQTAPLSAAELQRRLTAAGQQGEPPELHLRADQAVPYRAVAAVMAAAQQAGLARIGFVTAPPSGAPHAADSGVSPMISPVTKPVTTPSAPR